MAVWCQQHHLPLGGVISLDTAWKLAHAWYHDRLDPNWQRKSLGEAAFIFGELGMTGDFWHLA